MLQKPVSLKLLEAEFVCQCNYPEVCEDEGQRWLKEVHGAVKAARPLQTRNPHQVRRAQG
jgi:hypothetical protein